MPASARPPAQATRLGAPSDGRRRPQDAGTQSPSRPGPAPGHRRAVPPACKNTVLPAFGNCAVHGSHRMEPRVLDAGIERPAGLLPVDRHSAVTGLRRLALMMPFKFSDPGGCKPECQPRQQGDQVAQAQVTQGTRTVPVTLCTGDGARPRRRPGGGPGATGQIRQTRCRMIAGPRRGLAESDRPPLPA